MQQHEPADPPQKICGEQDEINTVECFTLYNYCHIENNYSHIPDNSVSLLFYFHFVIIPEISIS